MSLIRARFSGFSAKKMADRGLILRLYRSLIRQVRLG